MNIVFVSNFMNHHQYSLCQELIKRCDVFYFVSCSRLPDEQKKLGYGIYNNDFILEYSYEKNAFFRNLILNADSVIFGEKPNWVFKDRLNLGKNDFIYSERLFKKGRWRVLVPFIRNKLRNRYINGIKHLPNILCAGSYVCGDFSLIGYPKEKCLKWGYFPTIRTNRGADYSYLTNKKKANSIIWAGRLIDWKHPELALKLANKLKKNNYVFSLTIVGDGPLMKKMLRYINNHNLNDCVKLTGPVKADNVLEYFECSEIAIATSDKQEGWGAVVNEAMGSGCAAVVSKDMGCANFLISNNNNGLLFSNFGMLYHSVSRLLKDREYCHNLGANAFNTINTDWNYRTAAIRLINYINNKTYYPSNILSKAGD